MAEKVRSKERVSHPDTERSVGGRPPSSCAPPVQLLSEPPGIQQAAGNAAVQRLLRSGTVQAKLRVNRPGDRYEREADRVAEQVMRMPAPAVQRACACGGTCADCHEEAPAVLRSADAGTTSDGPAESLPSGFVRALGPGRPLDAATRAFFEPRFGQRFGAVRIHTDGRAARSAQAINARAYASGRDLVFGAGSYAPGTERGKRLLGHELTHVLQQHALRLATPDVQRLEGDFLIRGVSPEHDPSKIYFELGRASIPPGQLAKIAPLASPPTRDLTLFGYASEEGTAADNVSVTNSRIAAVSQALFRRGHRGARTPQPRPTGGVGQIEYRNLRAVEVLPTPPPVSGVAQVPTSSVNPCAGPAPAPNAHCGTVLDPCSNAPAMQATCGTAFTGAFPLAVTWAGTAIAKLGSTAAVDVAQTNALLGTLFPGVARAQVVTNVASIFAQVMNLPFQHRCHNECDGGCDRPAYNSRTGIGSTGAVMTLCPDFLASSNTTWQATILLHESIHGTAGVATRDLGYESSRLVASMTGTDALRNTDSYVLLIRLLHTPGSVTIGPAAAQRDTAAGMTGPEESSARQAVAYLESWLNYASFDTALVYGAVSRSVPPAAGWAATGSDPTFHAPTMHQLAPLFGLTDPGAAAPFTQPVDEDKHKLASIHDRYERMYSSVDRVRLALRKGPPGGESWPTSGLYLASTVTLDPTFFSLTLVQQIRHLLLLMARGLSVATPYQNAYVEAADRIRTRRTLGP